jgi:YbbR domain-containing protein
MVIAPEVRSQIQVESVSPSYAMVNLEQLSTITKQVKVNYTSVLPAGYAYGPPSVVPVRAKVSAPESTIDDVSELAVVIGKPRIDQEGAPEGVNEDLEIVALDDSGKRVAGATVSPTYAHVSLSVNKVATMKSAPITPSTIGQPAPGFSVLDFETDPQILTVSGAEDVLRPVNVIMTAPIDVSGAHADIVTDVPLRIPAGVNASARVAKIRVVIGPSLSKSTAPAPVLEPKVQH